MQRTRVSLHPPILPTSGLILQAHAYNIVFVLLTLGLLCATFFLSPPFVLCPLRVQRGLVARILLAQGETGTATAFQCSESRRGGRAKLVTPRKSLPHIENPRPGTRAHPSERESSRKTTTGLGLSRIEWPRPKRVEMLPDSCSRKALRISAFALWWGRLDVPSTDARRRARAG